MNLEIDDNEIDIGDKGDIPVEILNLLPDSRVTVLGLLQHLLPPVSHGFTLSSTVSFFDNSPPNVTDNEEILTLPIPPATSIITLDKAFPDAVQNGYQSLKCLHIALTVRKTYPLWIIPLWKIISRLHIVHSALKSGLVSVLLPFLDGPRTGPVPESFRIQEPRTGTT